MEDEPCPAPGAVEKPGGHQALPFCILGAHDCQNAPNTVRMGLSTRMHVHGERHATPIRYGKRCARLKNPGADR
jgi:hypothetical protein